MERYDLDRLLLPQLVSGRGTDGERSGSTSVLLNSVLGHISAMVFVFDRDMTLVWVDEYAASQFGFTPAEMIGKNW